MQGLLNDDAVTEVRANPDGKLWVHRLGQGKADSGIVLNPESIKKAIFTVAFSVGAICNESHPTIAAELPGTGERFQGVLPPLVSSPVFAIRKKAVRIFSLKDLVAQGVLSDTTHAYLVNAIKGRKNILIVGGTDSGKTTFANALLEVLHEAPDRIVLIEDTQELQCRCKDVTFLRTKDHIASLRDLVRVTLRLSPDRIVIGEVRGAEALDLLKSWNTGHSGGLSTIHASSAAQGLSRLEQLIQEAGVSVSKALIAESVNVLVYMEKVGTQRVVKEIVEVEGTKGDLYVFKDIFERS